MIALLAGKALEATAAGISAASPLWREICVKAMPAKYTEAQAAGRGAVARYHRGDLRR